MFEQIEVSRPCIAPRPARAIVVEDDPLVMNALKRHLKSMGWDVEIATTASEFLQRLVETPSGFSFAIIDINLPDMNGDQILSWMRASEETWMKDMPVIVLTGRPYLIKELFSDCPSSCMFLTKPYTQTELQACIESSLATRH